MTICLLDIARAIELLDNLLKCPDLQPAKLAALQRILQSDFLNIVREGYEHIYDTVDISGSDEVCYCSLETSSCDMISLMLFFPKG